MQEIALFLTGIAGIASAAAYRKFPKKSHTSIRINHNIEDKIHSLKIEKDIVTKTISRLHQYDTELSKIQKERLLAKYQHQLQVVVTKIERIEDAGKYPNTDPVKDEIIALMEQKISTLDQRLYELSSKISKENIQISEIKKESVNEYKKPNIKNEELWTKNNQPKKYEQLKKDMARQTSFTKFDPGKKPERPIELTTLTHVSNKPLEFPLIEKKNAESHDDVINEIVKPKEKFNIEQSSQTVTETNATVPELSKESSELDENSDEDLDKIKKDIMKVLSKLEQAEVE